MNQPLSLIDPTGEYWLWNPTNGHVWFGEPGKGPDRVKEAEKYNKVTANGLYTIIEDGSTFDIVAAKSTGIYTKYGGKKVRLNKNGTMDVVGLTESRKVAGLPSTGAGTGIVLTAVALSPIGLAPAAATVAVAGPVEGSIASAVLLHVILMAACEQTGHKSPTQSQDVPDESVVVRGGESDMPPSGQVFSGAFGPTLLDAASGVPHGQIRHTTAGAIRESGGTVIYAPEPAYPAALDGSYPEGPINYRHVNITLGSSNPFVGPISNPVPKDQRVPGRPKPKK